MKLNILLHSFIIFSSLFLTFSCVSTTLEFDKGGRLSAAIEKHPFGKKEITFWREGWTNTTLEYDAKGLHHGKYCTYFTNGRVSSVVYWRHGKLLGYAYRIR